MSAATHSPQYAAALAASNAASKELRNALALHKQGRISDAEYCAVFAANKKAQAAYDEALLDELFANVVKEGDDIDARAMVAREVLKEREWRIHGARVTPAMCAEYDAGHWRTVREFVEAECGEVLA